MLLSLSMNLSLPQAVRRPLNWTKTVAERKVQVLVLDPHRPAPAAHGDREFAQLVEIDPANLRWWELPKLSQLQLPKTWRLWKGSLGNGNSKPYSHKLGNLVQLNPNADSPDVSWEAYWLPISQPGRPHILEVDYPSDVPQTLGISVLEPNAAGALAAIGLDSGVDQQAEVIADADPPRMLRHRLIFWPRTNTPLVLLTNGRNHCPAVYGKIRVLADGEQLPRTAPLPPQQNQRLMAAYLDRPLFPENFSADEEYDDWCGRSLDNWNTFYEGGARLISYLQNVGYNGLMLGVLADGSTIYPSRLLDPTSRYDTGVFFTSAQDPMRKDVLEMLFRMFDREGMQLIPSLEFAAPLPELEAVRRAGGPEADAVQLIGADGIPFSSVYPPRRGLSPYYNVLNPRVQNAMLSVIEELVERYARHPSFSGIAIRLSADGYAQLPGPDWGLDDRTIAAFERDCKLSVPGEGPDRFAHRAAFLAQEPQRRTWLEWRGPPERILSEGGKNITFSPGGRPLVPGRHRDNRRRGRPGRAETRLVAPYHDVRHVFERGHRRKAFSDRSATRDLASPAPVARRRSNCQGRRVGIRPNARQRALLSGFAGRRQPVFSRAAGNSHSILRSEESDQAQLRRLDVAAFAVGCAESPPLRARSGRARHASRL